MPAESADDYQESPLVFAAAATEETEQQAKSKSKKQVDKESKKLKNKTKQAITVLCKAEDLAYEELFT